MLNKSAIAPIVTVLLLVVSNIFGVKFPNGIDQQISDFVANGLALYIVIAHGIVKNHKPDTTASTPAPAQPADAETSSEPR